MFRQFNEQRFLMQANPGKLSRTIVGILVIFFLVATVAIGMTLVI